MLLHDSVQLRFPRHHQPQEHLQKGWDPEMAAHEQLVPS